MTEPNQAWTLGALSFISKGPIIIQPLFLFPFFPFVCLGGRGAMHMLICRMREIEEGFDLDI